ncbi:hypothetical protein Afe04nite_40850 [Asanoa ferruginea]|uniref:sensor domain-containing diguanylate cyclase n=1 Tax=Asanoa ferruginea TaxID=53367 RepID=UPI0011C15654|nr:sensor domain-containing diguanylate cyclase [Asanoa ferruginea]GIF49546.1 hypothetical protein Afe04nite_40850 [Asanoa ferruginea]
MTAAELRRSAGPAGGVLARPWLWLLLGIFVAATIVILTGPAPAITSWVTQAVCFAVFAVLSWQLANSRRSSPRARRFWRAAAVSGVIFVAGAALRAIDVAVDPGLHSTAWTAPTALVTIGSAWLLAFIFICVERDGPPQRDLWIDAGTVVVAAAVFIWTIALTGALGAEKPEQKVWTAVGAIILLVSAFAVTHLLVTGTAPFPVLAGVAIGAAAALHGLERALNPQVMNADDAEWVLVIRLLPALLLAAAPCLAELGAVRPALSRRSAGFVAPLVALGTTQVLLIAQLSDEGLDARSWGTAMGTVIIAGLIILRQDGLLVQNARLVGRLDRTVDEVGRRERWFRSLVEHASDITMVLDGHGVITYVTPALRPMLGQEPAAAVGQPVAAALRPVDAERLEALLASVMAGRMVTATDELEVRRADGARRWLEVIATGRLKDPAVVGLVLNIRDVSDTVALRERLWHDASHDPLTGLANRTLFNERAEALREPAARGRGSAVLLLDLDQFKDVNDEFGHPAGDELLRIAARRIEHSVRPADTVARLGGDEFSVILVDTTEAAAADTARRIVDALARPVSIDDHVLRPAASVGVAVSVDKPIEALLRDADEAMYAAKRHGSGAELFHEHLR